MRTREIVIPAALQRQLQEHLFRNDLEQGAFLFAREAAANGEAGLMVADLYLVPEDGWQVQLDVYLEMKDTERARIMAMARKGDYAVIDCHSHPSSLDTVAFSPSDRSGITDFAAYAKWKLPGRPFAAVVWGEQSLDAVMWLGDFRTPLPVDQVRIEGPERAFLKPNGSWFATGYRRKPRLARHGS